MRKAIVMKRAGVLLTAFIALAVLSAMLAFKLNSNLNSGSVYCTSTCATSYLIAFRIDSDGTLTAPCGVGKQPYVLIGNADCWATISGTKFSQTDAGN